VQRKYRAFVVTGLLVWLSFVPARGAAQFDKYGGIMRVVGREGELFHLEQIGHRWWVVTPEGHGLFVRAVGKVDTADYGGSGGFLAYDAVYLQTADGAMSANLQAAAQSSLTGDVVHPASGATLKAKDDALYLGASRFKPNYTYFWMDKLGEGGKLQWCYSTAGGWKPVNDTGRPNKGTVLAADGGFHLDIGKYMAPDKDGFGQWDNPNANKVTWWDMEKGFPDDFAPVGLPGDSTPRYYLKAVVEEDFKTPPVLSQVYERAELAEWIAKKYAPGDYYGKWARAMTQRLRWWGFNVAGLYSPRYTTAVAGLADRLPVEPTWALGGWATRKDRPWHAKNVYAGAVFPPGSKSLLWQGLQPDVFDPQFRRAYRALVVEQAASQDAWSWALVPEEADYLFGIDSLAHDHMGYVVLSQNAYHPRANRDGQEIVFDDPRFYAKYAFRDLLRYLYRSPGEPLRAFTPRSAVPCYEYARQPAGPELIALRNLNAAWGTGYTTWDTSAGDLLAGSNAWGTGTGFMDEDGKSILAQDARSVGFDKSFTDPAHPAIRKDLDAFVEFFAARYGTILAEAFAQVAHPILLLPVYNGPDFVYRALAPYVDGFWVNVSDPNDALRIYNAGHKPLMIGDYLTADPDSPLYFNATVESLRYDAASGNTIITAPDLRYVFRTAQTIAFPDCSELAEKNTCAGKWIYPYPRVKSARWSTIEVPGDFTGCVKPGMHVELSKYGKYPYPRRTQEDRARDMIQHYKSLLNWRGDDGLYFVIGIEHWCLYDPAVSNWTDNENFGLATLQDNAYDGIEARQAAGTDPRGYSIGGEDADYGDLLTSLSQFLRGIHDVIPVE
jgi:hypothetical protein